MDSSTILSHIKISANPHQERVPFTPPRLAKIVPDFAGFVLASIIFYQASSKGQICRFGDAFFVFGKEWGFLSFVEEYVFEE